MNEEDVLVVATYPSNIVGLLDSNGLGHGCCDTVYIVVMQNSVFFLNFNFNFKMCFSVCGFECFVLRLCM